MASQWLCLLKEDVKFFLVTETKQIGEGLGLKHDQVMEMAEDLTSLLSDWDYENEQL